MNHSPAARINQMAAWTILLVLIIPSLVSFPVSVTSKTYLSLPWEGVSLQHFRNLFGSEEWLSSFGQSFVIAVTASFLATTVGTLSAIGLWRISSRLGEMVRAFLLLPLMVPPIISAMAFYRWWVPLGLIDSYLGIIVAHTILAMPMVLITVSAALAVQERLRAGNAQQAPDQRIAWTSRTGEMNAGVVTFHRIDNDTTRVMLQMEYVPEGVVENVGSALGFVTRRVDGDLKRFKDFIESRGHETGAWRGSVHQRQN